MLNKTRVQFNDETGLGQTLQQDDDDDDVRVWHFAEELGRMNER